MVSLRLMMKPQPAQHGMPHAGQVFRCELRVLPLTTPNLETVQSMEAEIHDHVCLRPRR